MIINITPDSGYRMCRLNPSIDFELQNCKVIIAYLEIQEKYIFYVKMLQYFAILVWRWPIYAWCMLMHILLVSDDSLTTEIIEDYRVIMLWFDMFLDVECLLRSCQHFSNHESSDVLHSALDSVLLMLSRLDLFFVPSLEDTCLFIALTNDWVVNHITFSSISTLYFT